jgi:hypothetical protein
MGLDAGNIFIDPEGADGVVTLLDQHSHVFSYADFGYKTEDTVTYDANGAPVYGQHHSFSSVKITAVETSVGTLTYNGAAVTAGATISIFQLSNLVYTAPADALGKGAASIQFSVIDSNGGIDNTPNMLTIDLVTQNSAPFGADNTLTILEDQSISLTAANFGFSDANDTTHPNSLAALWLGGINGHGFFTLDGESFGNDRLVYAADIGKLAYTAQANYNGNDGLVLDFNVFDDGGTDNGGQNASVDYNTLTIKVVSVNDAPTGADKTLTYLEDSGKHVLSADLFGFSDAGDSAAPNSLSKVIIDTISGGGAFMLGDTEVHAGDVITTSQLASFTFQASGNDAGSDYASLKFRLVDDGGTTNGGSDTETTAHRLTFDITGVNDAPTGADKTLNYLEDSGKHVLSADLFGFFEAGDSAAPNGLSKVIIDKISGGGAFLLGNTRVENGDIIGVSDLGSLTFHASADGFGDAYASLKFRLVDDGGTDNGGIDTETASHMLTFDITSVNDAPSGANKVVTFREDSGKQVLKAAIFGFSDMADAAAPDTLAKIIIDKIAGKGTFMLGKSEVHAGDEIETNALANLTFQSAKSGFGNNYASLTFRLVDDGGTDDGGTDTEAVAHTLKFNVTDVADTFVGTAGKNVLRGTAGHDILDGKGGKDKLTGLGGADTFVFSRGYGEDAISDFDAKGADHDTLDLRKLNGVDSFKDLRAHHIERSGADVVITGDHGDQVTLNHVKMGDLAAAVFLF